MLWKSYGHTECGTDIGSRVVGTVFDVKRFAIHDGPGIRTTAFLKGCPLSCTWCHNPESQRSEPELLFRGSRCIGCGTCVATCPEDAIRVERGKAITDRERCAACGACVPACLVDAREVVGWPWTAEELVGELRRDALFFEESGGGVTLSGGEPLLQPTFCAAVLERCRARGIHTAVDTCGHAGEDALERVVAHADLFLYDVKLMDGERHRQATGETNAQVLANLEWLDRRGKRIWIRVPLIPGINDDEENLLALAAFVRGLRRVERVQVLPFHRGGEGKQAGLGRKPVMPAIDPEQTTEATDRALRTLSERMHVPVTQGG